MSTSEYSAEEIIETYESQVATVEAHLLELEEAAKDLSPDGHEDLQQLEQVADEWAEPILDSYDQAEQLKNGKVDRLKQQLETVLDDPGKRYRHLPQSLSKHEEMHEEIEDITQTLHDHDEWIDYVSYELQQETDKTLEQYAGTDPCSGRIDQLRSRVENNDYVARIRQEIAEDPELAFYTGLAVGGAGLVAADYILDRIGL